MAFYIIEIRRPNAAGPLGGPPIATLRFDVDSDREALHLAERARLPLFRRIRLGDMAVVASARNQFDMFPRVYRKSSQGFEPFDDAAKQETERQALRDRLIADIEAARRRTEFLEANPELSREAEEIAAKARSVATANGSDMEASWNPGMDAFNAFIDSRMEPPG